jgi:GntR family transcriptional regulator/MocR family aminotransferase
MRGLYRSRRDALLAALEQSFPGWRAHGAAAGLHLVAETPPELDLDELVLRSAERSVRLYPLARYTSDDRRPHGLVFGYARLTEEEITEAVRRMEGALAAMSV